VTGGSSYSHYRHLAVPDPDLTAARHYSGPSLIAGSTSVSDVQALWSPLVRM